MPEASLIAVINKNSRGTKALKFLFDALADGGCVQALDKINSLLPEAKQNGPWYVRSRCRACALSGETDQWFDEWNKKLDQCTTVRELEILGYSFPDSEFYNLLELNPKLLKQCKTFSFSGFERQVLIWSHFTLVSGDALARNYAAQKVTSPMGAIWCYHVINGNKEIAQNLWTEFIQDREDILYRPIIKKADQENNADIMHDLINCLQTSYTGRDNLDGAYSTLLDIYVRKKQFDDALEIVEILKTRSAEVNRSTLGHLKFGLRAQGKEFPYTYSPTKLEKKVVLTARKYTVG